MQFTRSRVFGRHAQRNFDQERADLNEGYRNLSNVYESNLNKALASDKYSSEQKRALLQHYKEECLRLEANYSADMQRINDEEAQYRVVEGYDGAYVPEAHDTADDYCNFANQSGYDASSDAMDYCGSVDFTDSTEDNTSENDLSNGM